MALEEARKAWDRHFFLLFGDLGLLLIDFLTDRLDLGFQLANEFFDRCQLASSGNDAARPGTVADDKCPVGFQ